MNTSSVVDSAAGAEGLAQRDAKAIASLDIHELARLPQAEIDAAVAELHAIDERHAERLAEFEAARQDVDKGHRLLVDKARAKVDAEMAAKYKPTKISKNGPDTVLTFRSAKQALAYSREYDARLESVLAPLREDYGTALSSLSSLEEYRASYEEEEAVRGRIHRRRIAVLAERGLPFLSTHIEHGERWLAQRPGRTGSVTPTAGDLWLGTAAEPVSVSEDVAQVTQGLELLRDAYGRVRTCEHVQRIALFDRDEPEKYCATCESRLVTVHARFCSAKCAKAYPRREEMEKYQRLPGIRCAVCRRTHTGGAAVPPARVVPLDDDVTCWGRGLDGSGVPRDLVPQGVDGDGVPYPPAPVLWDAMRSERGGRIPVCSAVCWAWLVVDQDEPPSFDDVVYYATGCNGNGNGVAVASKAVPMTSTERSRLHRERKRLALTEGGA